MAGIAAFIAFDSLLAGMDRMTIDSMMDLTSSGLVIRSPEYERNSAGTPLAHGIEDPAGAMALLKERVPGIEAATARTKFIATVSNYTDDMPVVAIALDPESDGSVFTLASHMAQGGWFDEPAAKTVVMGGSLAKELGLKLGDYVLVSARTVNGNVNADEYRIEGLSDASAPEIDRGGLFMSYITAKTLLGEELPVTELDAAIPRRGNLDSILKGAEKTAREGEKSIEAAGRPPLSFTPIGVLAGEYLAMRNMKAKYSFMIILVVLAIAAVGIVNTILMSVYARIREIGILLAYGMRRKDIRRLFAFEGLIVGSVGSLGGLALGALIVWYLAAVGLNLDAMMGKVDFGTIPLSGILRGEWKPATMLLGFMFGVACSWLAALIPARKASRMLAIDALRFV
jgi:putative ABC transport system permease protein